MRMKLIKLKSVSVIALAVAGTFTAGAYAGGTHNSVEVQTPTSVSESAPWLTAHPHLGHSSSRAADLEIAFQQSSDVQTLSGTEVTSDISGGAGASGYDSTSRDELRSDAGVADDQVAIVEYWLIGVTPEESSASATGEVGADEYAYVLTPIYEEG